MFFSFICFCLVHFKDSGHTILIEMIRGEILGYRYSNSKKKCSCKQDDCWDAFEECKKNMKNKIKHAIVAVYKGLEMS